MKREKKIGFNYSLYKTEKHKEVNNNKDLYPIMVTVTYDRKSTRFPYIRLDCKSFFTIDEFNKGIKNTVFIERVESIVTKVIRYEANLVEENYKVKGIKDRLGYYDKYVIDLLGSHLSSELTNVLGDYFTYNEFKKLDSDFSSLESLIEQESQYLGDIIFFREYDFFNGIKFLIKEKLPMVIIQKIIAFSLLVVYENHFDFKTSSIGKSSRLFDWLVTPSFIINFKKFVESKELLEQAIKVLANKDKYFEQLSLEYRNELLNSDFIKIKNTIDSVMQQSGTYKHLMQHLNSMKKVVV